MKILQFIPCSISGLNGIADYACALSEQLMIHYGIVSSFVSPGAVTRTQEVFEYGKLGNQYTLHFIPSDEEKAFMTLLSDVDALILHHGFYVLPFLSTIEVAQKIYKFRLISMFHELIPPKMALKREFVSRFKQILPTRDPGIFRGRVQLAKMSDFVLTNTLKFQTTLSSWLGYSVECLPCFSNVGEPKVIPSLKERERRMTVFGSPGTRARVYFSHLDSLILSCKELGINEIYDIGNSDAITLPDLASYDIKITSLGTQPQKVIQDIFLKSQAGFVDYSHNIGTLGKSGVLAAYCAYGMLPVSSICHPADVNGFASGKHYFVSGNKFDNSMQSLQLVASVAHAWYVEHNLKKTTDVYARILGAW